MQLDVFSSDPAFTVTELTQSINLLSYQPTKLQRLGWFTQEPIDTTSVNIEMEGDVLTLVPAKPRGAPGEVKGLQRRNLRNFQAIHLPQRTALMADEVQNLRAFGSQTETELAKDRLMKKVKVVRRDLDLTIEYHRMGALKGLILDATGSTILDLYAEFGVSQQTQDMALDVMLEHWNEQKASPPWMPDELAVKVQNAFKFATGGWGAMTAAGDFDALETDLGEPPAARSSEAKPDSLEPAKKRAMHFLTYDEMCAMPEPEWLVEGVIQKRSAALLFGKSNTFKSFLAIDLGLSVAAGIPWHGNPVSQGRVLIVATEGANGVGRKRVPGWFEHHEVPAAIRHNVRLYPTEISLDVKEDVDRFIASAKSIGE